MWWTKIEDGEIVEQQWVTDLRDAKHDLRDELLDAVRPVYELLGIVDGGDES